MSVPDYAILIVMCTSLFVFSSIAVMLTYGLQLAGLGVENTRKFARNTALYLLIWVSIAFSLSYSNVLVPTADQSFPLLLVLILGPAILGNTLMFRSTIAKAVLDVIPVHWFATLQIYRVVGVMFLLLESDKLLPAYFAISTGWGDIFIGVTAPVVGYLLWKDTEKFRAVGLAWCVIGIGDLFLVLFKAVNSSPGPLQTTSFDLPTVIIGYFPMPIIALLVVPVSIILHIQMIRKLIKRTYGTVPENPIEN